MAKNRKRQGWHGDPEGHANAGRKGGLARARNRKRKQVDIDMQDFDENR